MPLGGVGIALPSYTHTRQHFSCLELSVFGAFVTDLQTSFFKHRQALKVVKSTRGHFSLFF